MHTKRHVILTRYILKTTKVRLQAALRLPATCTLVVQAFGRGLKLVSTGTQVTVKNSQLADATIIATEMGHVASQTQGGMLIVCWRCASHTRHNIDELD